MTSPYVRCARRQPQVSAIAAFWGVFGAYLLRNCEVVRVLTVICWAPARSNCCAGAGQKKSRGTARSYRSLVLVARPIVFLVAGKPLWSGAAAKCPAYFPFRMLLEWLLMEVLVPGYLDSKPRKAAPDFVWQRSSDGGLSWGRARRNPFLFTHFLAATSRVLRPQEAVALASPTAQKPRQTGYSLCS